MFSNYKNFDRLSYQLYNIQLSFRKADNEQLKKYEVPIFSGIASAVITLTLNESVNMCIFIRILMTIFVYLVSYFILGILFRGIGVVINELFPHNKSIDENDTVKYRKDFDNIACNSLIMALGYIENINHLKSGQDNIRNMYIYEMIHYLETACTCTVRLISHKEYCINDGRLGEGVDKYRVTNALNIMNDIADFIDAVISSVPADNHLLTQVRRIHDDINHCMKDLN